MNIAQKAINSVCWAAKANGKPCGAPAVAIDPKRGHAVCEEHKTKS